MELSCRSSLLTHSPLSFFGQSVYLSLSFSHAPSSFCFGLSSTAQLSVIELAAELLPQLGHYPQLLRVPTSTSIRVPREAREPGIWHLLLIEPESLRRAMSAITRFAPKTTTTTNSFSCQGCLHTFGVALPGHVAIFCTAAVTLGCLCHFFHRVTSSACSSDDRQRRSTGGSLLSDPRLQAAPARAIRKGVSQLAERA